jgi:hypothetical protein
MGKFSAVLWNKLLWGFSFTVHETILGVSSL